MNLKLIFWKFLPFKNGENVLYSLINLKPDIFYYVKMIINLASLQVRKIDRMGLLLFIFY